MKILNQFKIATQALACATLVLVATTAAAKDIEGHGGDNFTITPTPTPGVVTDTLNGVARISFLGNCSFHGEQAITLPATPDQPYVIKGMWRFTSADGATTLDIETNGTGRPDPTNPGFINLHLKVKFTGGTGRMAGAQGKGEIDGVGMFTSPAGGTATWFLDGDVSIKDRKHGDRDHDDD
jgi:hypothetical protein